MKKCMLFICLLVPVVFNASAQNTIHAEEAKSYEGKIVEVQDVVKSIRIISPTFAFLVLGYGAPDSCITVVLRGKGATHNATDYLKKFIVAKGRIIIVNRNPLLVISKAKSIWMSNCTCLIGEKNPEVLVDTIKFPNERAMYHIKQK